MIGPVFALVGFVWGLLVARKRGGKRLDCLQYGAGYGIAFGLVGTFTGIALARFLVPHG
jgi:flagellar motor component MotA